MAAMLEHVNITVTDPDKQAEVFCRLFDWKVRWSGASMYGGRSVHVGSEDAYVALYSPDPGKVQSFEKGVPMNHVGIVVEDLDAVEGRVVEAGFKPFAHDDYEPGRRFYFFDGNGIEFEIVSYS